MSPIEIAAVTFGFLCVFLTVKENIWCWPTGLVQVFLYIFIFYDAKLYSDVILHIIYVFMQIYGWYFWLRGGERHQQAKISTLSHSWFSFYLAVSAIATLALGHLMATRTDAALPWGDAFTTIFSLSAQWLLSRKKLESWHFWISVDCVAIVIYFAKGLYLTSGLYIAFLIMAIAGLYRWKNTLANLQLESTTVAPTMPAEVTT